MNRLIVFAILAPIFSEFLSRASGNAGMAMLFKVAAVIPIFIAFIDTKSLANYIALIIFMMVVVSVNVIFPPLYIITALADVFVFSFVLLCMLKLDLRKVKQNLIGFGDLERAIEVGIFLAVGICFVSVAINILNNAGYNLLKDYFTPLEHSVRYLKDGELSLISGIFASSKKLGKYCLVLLVLACFIPGVKKVIALQLGIILLILVSGSREALYSGLLIMAAYYFSLKEGRLIIFLITFLLSFFIVDFINVDFYFSQSKDAFSRVESYYYMLNNLHEIGRYGFGIVGRAVALLGLDNIQGVVPYSFKGAAHDSGLLWLYVCLSDSALFVLLIFVFVIMWRLVSSFDVVVAAGYLIFFFNFVKAQSTVYDFFFVFCFLFLIRYLSYAKKNSVS